VVKLFTYITGKMQEKKNKRRIGENVREMKPTKTKLKMETCEEDKLRRKIYFCGKL
jgi:hypothetical protein